MVSPTSDRRQGLVGNTPFKAPVTVIATGPLTLSGEQTIDGVAVKAVNAAGYPDRVLVLAQADPTQNGIYDVSTASWTLSLDADGNYDLTNGTLVTASQGSQAGQIFRLSASNPVTPGSSAQSWSLQSFGNPMTFVSNYAALRLLSKTGSGKAFVTGNNTQYVYTPADTTSPDNGLSIIVAADGGRWYAAGGDPGPVLSATEGVTFANGYQSIAFGNQTVPAVPGEVRYWTANYTLNIPAGVTLTSGDVRQDMVSVSGHSRSQSVNSRIWGMSGLAQMDAACTTNGQLGQGFGGEFDNNNNSGHDMLNLSADGDYAPLMLAVGGANVAKAMMFMSAVGTSQAFTGWNVRQDCIHHAGHLAYFDNIAPLHGLYFSDVYTGGDAMSMPPQKPINFRMTSGSPGSIQSVGTTLQLNTGTTALTIASNDNTTTLVSIGNGGAVAVGTALSTEKFRIQANNTGTSRALILFNGDASINTYTDFGNTTSAIGENAAHAQLYVRKDATTGRSINAAGTLNASGADYAEYMRKAPGCGVIPKGALVGVNAAGLLTDKWADAVSFVIKSTNPSFVGGDSWGTEDSVGLSAPVPPMLVLPDYDGPNNPGTGPHMPRAPRAPRPDDDGVIDPKAFEQFKTSYAHYLADVASLPEQQRQHDNQVVDFNVAVAAHQARMDLATQMHETVALPQYARARAAFDAAHDTERAAVDRIAYAGQVPVSVLGATPGQHILAVQDGDGIKGVAVDAAALTLAQYIAAVGIVQNVLPDGRANVRVKVA